MDPQILTWPLCLQILYHWQTLIAGVIAFLAALWTISQIRRQIKLQKDIEEDRRKREELAARAALPLGLAKITEYAKDCVQLLAPLVPADTESLPAVPKGMQPPRIPPDAVAFLQASARYAAPDIASDIAVLLNILQVQNARLSSLLTKEQDRQGVVLRQEVLDRMVDAAELMARTGNLYDYGRDTKGMRTKSPRDKLYNAVQNCGLWQDEHPIFDHIAKLKYPEK